MILPDPKDAIHKAWLYRVLTDFCDNHVISSLLYFKGGTCAAMQGLLDRFSIDLDFDYMGQAKDLENLRNEMEKVFNELGLEIKDKSENGPQYFLKYTPGKPNERSTIKIDATMPPPQSNEYGPIRLSEIDRVIYCQTISTMFANKLVVLIERFEKNNSIAARDLYDIHYFFLSGHRYNEKVIIERRKNNDMKLFFGELSDFVKTHITEKVILQDLNMLLPYDKFKMIRKVLKQETLMFLDDEMKRF